MTHPHPAFRRLLAGASLLTLLGATSAALAAPIHYYRFESGAETEDSVGDLDLNASPAVLPNAGFDDPVPLTGQSNGQVLAAPTQTAATAGIVQNGQSVTVEGYFNTSVAAADLTTGQQTLAAQWGSGENQTLRVNLQAAGDGVDGTGSNGQTYRLVTVLRQRSNDLFTAASDLVGANPDDIVIQANTNYYFAMIFDNDADELTYVVENLDTQTTQSFTQARGFGNWEETGAGTVSAQVTIGQVQGGGQAFTGIIDEVRFSDSALATDQLLNVPEPGALGLTLLGGGLVFFRRRKPEPQG